MTAMTNDELKLVLGQAKSGDKLAEQNLLIYIRNNYMNRRIGRYLGRNRLADNDDLRQEFMIGVAFAIPKCDLEIGNPIEYLLAQGVYRVRSYLRGRITKNTVQVCRECGTVTRLNMVGNQYVCKKCGSINIDTHEIDDNDEITLENAVDMSEPIDEMIANQMMIEQFELTLVEGSNVKALYELLKSGINRDNPMIKNYTKEIARIWGGCSEQNVIQTLYKLRKKMLEFAESQGFTIRGDKFVYKED